MSRRQKISQFDTGPEAILPLADFRDDPWGTGDEKAVAFKSGVLSSPVPATFAKRMRDTGKAAPRPDAAPEPDPSTAADTAADQPSQD
ncbi:hypothetical protein MAUB1S_11466 [Mycolicibacterium aubagnense]